MQDEDKLRLKLDVLKKARDSLKLVAAMPKTDIVRDSAIQRFVCTYELAWKMFKRFQELNIGKSEFNVKNLWREAGAAGIIDDVELWFSFHAARNKTSHTYHEGTAEEVYGKAIEFSRHIDEFIHRLEKNIG